MLNKILLYVSGCVVTMITAGTTNGLSKMNTLFCFEHNKMKTKYEETTQHINELNNSCRLALHETMDLYTANKYFCLKCHNCDLDKKTNTIIIHKYKKVIGLFCDRQKFLHNCTGNIMFLNSKPIQSKSRGAYERVAKVPLTMKSIDFLMCRTCTTSQCDGKIERPIIRYSDPVHTVEIELSTAIEPNKANASSLTGSIGISVIVILAVTILLLFCLYVRKSTATQMQRNGTVSIDDPMQIMQKYRHQLGITDSTANQEIPSVSRATRVQPASSRTESVVHVCMNDLLEHERQRMNTSHSAPEHNESHAANKADSIKTTNARTQNVPTASNSIMKQESVVYKEISPSVRAKKHEHYCKDSTVKTLQKQDSFDEYYENCEPFRKPDIPVKTPESHQFVTDSSQFADSRNECVRF